MLDNRRVAGESSLHVMRHLLCRAVWDADVVRDEVREYIVEHLYDEAAVPWAPSFSDGAGISVPSLSIRVQPASGTPSTSTSGKPSGRSRSSSYTRRRTVALARSARAPGEFVEFPQRPPRGGMGGDRAEHRALVFQQRIARMQVAPRVIATARSTITCPRSCSGTNPGRASAADSSPLRPVRSASSRRCTPPSCPTCPFPAPDIARPRAHSLPCT